eukprot:1154202-Pelagomonas_calceolata.AAC.7
MHHDNLKQLPASVPPSPPWHAFVPSFRMLRSVSTHLGGHQHHVDVLAEVNAIALHHTKQESVGQAQGGTGLHGSQQAGVQLGLREGYVEQI